jgi:UDP-N-acetylmuramoylalanine-D-glutamate ligase
MCHFKVNTTTQCCCGVGALSLRLWGQKFGTQDKIADAIRNFPTLPHRLEIVAQRDGITWVNDSQSTIPDASIAALRVFPLR